MKVASKIPLNYFVDEAGDPVFYNAKGEMIVGQEGCSRILMIGYIRTEDPAAIRKSLANVRNQVKQDRYLESVPSVRKSLTYFHAKDDCPEVRHMVYSAIKKMIQKRVYCCAQGRKEIQEVSSRQGEYLL